MNIFAHNFFSRAWIALKISETAFLACFTPRTVLKCKNGKKIRFSQIFSKRFFQIFSKAFFQILGHNFFSSAQIALKLSETAFSGPFYPQLNFG